MVYIQSKKENNMFPLKIKEIVKDLPFTKDDIGRSRDEVYIFDKRFVLKISTDSERLFREKERVDFLNNAGFPGSKSVLYLEQDDKFYYLRTCLDGDSLIDKRFIENPSLLISVISEVFSALRSLDGVGCPFKSTDNEGDDFIHGDLCLPNIYVDKDNRFIGFIDLDNSGLGDRWYDIAWILWSLEYNLSTDKYNEALLSEIGVVFDRDKFEEYIPEKLRGMRL